MTTLIPELSTDAVLDTLRKMADEMKLDTATAKHRYFALHQAANMIEASQAQADALDRLHEAAIELGLIHVEEDPL